MTARSAMAGLVLAFGLLCAAEAAEFQPGVKIEADGKAIQRDGAWPLATLQGQVCA